MEEILAIAFFLVLVIGVIGLIKPKWAGVRSERRPRVKVLLVYGGIMFLLLILIGVVVEEDTSQPTQQASSSSTNSFTNQETINQPPETQIAETVAVATNIEADTNDSEEENSEQAPVITETSDQPMPISTDPEVQANLDIVLGDGSTSKIQAALNLMNMGERASGAVSHLIPLLLDEQEYISARNTIARTIAELATIDHVDQVDSLIEVLKLYANSTEEMDNNIRQNTLIALRNIGTGLQPVVPYIYEILQEDPRQLRFNPTKVEALTTLRVIEGVDKQVAFPLIIDVIQKHGASLDVQETALYSLYWMGPTRNEIPVLISYLQDTSETNRIFLSRQYNTLIGAAAKVGPAIIDPLRPLLFDENSTIAERALHVLGAMEDEAKPALDDLLAIYTEREKTDYSIRPGRHSNLAGEILYGLGPEPKIIRAFLHEELREDSTTNLYTYAYQLTEHGAKVVPHLAESFERYPRDDAYRRITELLMEIGEQAKPATDQLLAAMANSDDTWFLRLGVKFITTINPTPKAAPIFVNKLRLNYNETTAAIEGLDEAIIGFGSHSVEPLRTILADPRNTHHRIKAAELLGKIGSPAKASIGDLVGILDNPEENWSLRVAAMTALEQFGEDAKAAIPTTIEFLISSNVSYQARNTLVAIGPAAVEPLEEIVTATERRFLRRVPVYEDEQRMEAVRTMGQIGRNYPAQVVSRLVRLYNDVDSERLRSTIIYAFRDTGPGAKSAVSLLEKVLGNEEQIYAATSALASIGADGVNALTKQLGHKSREVRVYSAQALGEIGPDASGAVKQLERLLQDESPNVRRAAVEALEKITGKDAYSIE